MKRSSKGQFVKGMIPYNKYLTPIKCLVCGHSFQPRVKKSKYCSFGCYWKSLSGKPSWNKGVPWPEEWKLKESRKRIGIRLNTGKTHFKKGQIPWNYKGGITEKTNLLKGSQEYKNWRSSVFRRDRWSCVLCGYKSTKRRDIESDHIKPFALFPELRFDTTNGRTLCIECHKLTKSYKNSKMRREDFLWQTLA